MGSELSERYWPMRVGELRWLLFGGFICEPCCRCFFRMLLVDLVVATVGSDGYQVIAAL